MKILYSHLLTIILFVPTAEATFFSAGAAYEDVLNGKALVLDVRDIVKKGHVVASFAYSLKFPATTTEWPLVLDQLHACIPSDMTVYVYCYAGSMSSYFAKELNARGIKAFNIGHFDGWVSEGLPTEILNLEPINVTCPF